ncbi:thiol reductant ABC exporter subunit CydD [Amycolatopsis sp. YIM 10]|uniref:thiol reductant ABC exporter subunit CydD n=1 Tax=Amycolatopsis sp. YIM 10 TaxID=2653857 RepID=UPI00128FD600|nr:thiol reductant ABC exporter subunit CydD [Amycolatopsis sp. YIM 10]QFU85403.1 ATP-binding/permease protein CydD [Amycolatopsis sp. YIM 10]
MTPGRTTLPAKKLSTVDKVRPGPGPLGALPSLSPVARRALALAAVLAAANAALLVAQAFLLASILASIVGGGEEIGGRTAWLLGAVGGRALVGWAVRVVSARAAAGAKEELRAKVVDHAAALGPEWIAARGTGELTALTTRGLDALDAYFTTYLPALVTAAVVPVGAGAAVLFADWPSAVLIAVTLPLLPMFAILVGKYTADRVSDATEATHRLSGRLLELIRALPVLAAFRRAGAQAEVVRRVSDRHRRDTLKTLRVAFSSAFVLELAATLSVALVAVVIGVRLVSGDLTLAIGLGVLILAPECFQPLRNAGAAFHASEDGVEAVRRVAEVLAEPVPAPGARKIHKGQIEVRDLRVLRRGGFAPDGETFTADPGEITWLRAPSGAGKSTTLAALLGFVQPESGSVTIGGQPLAEADLAHWRRQVAWVPQSPAFTGGTVREELRLALADQEVEPAEDELLSVLVAVWLSGQVDQPVSHLSTGQRQRVAVARALLRARYGAWLLLLDEPTAHLDAASARRVQKAIKEVADSGATVVIAAHDRLTSFAEDEPAEATTAADAPAEPDAKPIGLRRLVDRAFLTGAGLGAAAFLAGIALTATSGWLIAKASQQPPILTLTVAVVGVRTFGLARAGLRYLERLATHDGAFRTATSLRVDLWRALVRIGPVGTSALRDGEGQRRLVSDVDTVRDLLPRVVSPPLVAVLVVAGAVAVQTAVLPIAGLYLAVAALVAGLLAPALALLLERRSTSALAEGRRDVSARVLTLFEGAAELLAFGAYRRQQQALAHADDQLTAGTRRQAFGAGAADALVVLAMGGAAVAATLAAAASGALNPVLAPIVALVPLALAEVLLQLPPVAQHWDELRRARTRLAAVLTAPDGPRPEHAEDVELTGVDVRWPGAPEPVLKDVTLTIPRGATVAITGPSGAGKSSLLALLLGFLAPERGSVRTPGAVAWAPQEPGLVATTVAENLRLADPHATPERLRAALTTAGLADLPAETLLGSGGAGLSGGQAQRVALARALLAAESSALVLLDEPTSHLDEQTAYEVRAGLAAALAGRTVVWVTHRMEEAAAADLHLDVRDGRVHVLSRSGV